MSHTTHTTHAAFIHDGDFDGEVIIIIRGADGAQDEQLTLDIQDLLEFVAEIVRDKRIARLEEMTPEQLLGFDGGVR